MRNYWFRIGMSAFAIFGVGMLVWSMIQGGKRKVVQVVQSADPITIPLALVPFTVNGSQLGTLRRVQLVRSSPDRVSAINFRVKLADSVSDARLADCVLVTGGSLEKVSQEHTFNCVPGADTSGKTLERIGEIETQHGGTFSLLGEPGTLESIQLDFAAHQQDSLGAVAEAQAESLAAAHEAMGDSIARHMDSVLADMEPRMRAKVDAALKKAEAARRKAEAAAPEPPVPPRP